MAKKRNNRGKNKRLQTGNKSSLADTINSKVIAEALTSVINQNQQILMKVCRLCETKDGPFLNIFDAEKVTAKKIDDLMPFVINENDDLPHKICFRCSAKVEELYEFVQKCVKTQNNLRDTVGKGPVPIKTKNRKIWEHKLNQAQMLNDDICESLIKKAMEGIKVLKPDEPEEVTSPNETTSTEIPLKESINEAEVQTKKTKSTRNKNEREDVNNVTDVPEKQIKPTNKNEPENTAAVRSTRSKIADAFNDDASSTSSKKSMDGKDVEELTEQIKTNSSVQTKSNSPIPTKAQNVKSKLKDEKVKKEKANIQANQTEKKVVTTNIFSLDESEKEDDKKDKFNIMDHVSMIKVNGVGVLFQCKLCNRNFLKEDVVKTHSCAKNGPKLTDKIDLTKSVTPPEPPKGPIVKYIHTKNHEPKRVDDILDKSVAFSKPKPKIGPASKIKRDFEEAAAVTEKVVTPREVTPSGRSPVLPSLQFPSSPSLHSRYKLVPGPNNTFTLVEEPTTAHVQDAKTTNVANQAVDPDPPISVPAKGKIKKTVIQPVFQNMIKENPVPTGQPYPVGLFQTVPHHSGVFSPPAAVPVTFTTPAMKKQSYTIVKTGNPSKLLISTKPPSELAEEPAKKRQKKTKQDTKLSNDVKKPQYTAAVQEEIVPEKNEGYFSFINVDPLVDSSYVLPTDSIIQESQITTSSSVAKPNEEENKYSCNMCGEKFSREKKLLAHIQSHYKQMDMEDQQRTGTLPKKRGRPFKKIVG